MQNDYLSMLVNDYPGTCKLVCTMTAIWAILFGLFCKRNKTIAMRDEMAEKEYAILHENDGEADFLNLHPD